MHKTMVSIKAHILRWRCIQPNPFEVWAGLSKNPFAVVAGVIVLGTAHWVLIPSPFDFDGCVIKNMS